MADKTFAPVFHAPSLATRPIRTPKTAEIVARTLRTMIIEGALKDGDHLPHEADLMDRFAISRPTLREAIRLLESDGLVEVRRGSRAGARVCVPGPEVVARPASMLLELSGATIADLFVAREAVEPDAARVLAAEGSEEDFDELARMVEEDLPASYASKTLVAGLSAFHLRVVQLSGNAPLAIIAGMLYELTRHDTGPAVLETDEDRELYAANLKLAVRSCRRLIRLLRSRDADAAFSHWRKHVVNARPFLIDGRGAESARGRVG
ncbi:FadR/GntR family transcriptional regulator [Rhodococcus sp. NPDC058505]|uniref:FadR/GntR family transcriptional regulator n=1 Tax=unclassified Rhodococcus (in: high G+C Gram-positive bacteria) TaxID=192944 RepID=UPI00365EBDF5